MEDAEEEEEALVSEVERGVWLEEAMPRAWRAVVIVGISWLAVGCQGKIETERGDSAPGASRSAPATGADGSVSTSATASGRPVVLFVGTSLTAGLGLDPDSAYPQLIQQKIDAAGLGYEVVNAGVSGETSAGLLRRLDWLLRGTFDVLVLETGANDGLRGTPVATVRRNIRAILDSVRATRPTARLFLVQMEAPPNLGAKYAREFHDLYVEVARETGATLLPFLLDGVAGNSALNQGDGIHPNMQGERIVADNVWRGLSAALSGK
jgi:acyl-CoA thioesterase-1